MRYVNPVGVSEAELGSLGSMGGRRGMYMPGMFNNQGDTFASQNRPKDFSILRAAGQFFKGAVVDTISGLFSVKGLATLAIAGGICALGGAPLVLGAGLVMGGLQLGSGVMKFASNYSEGNYEGAENAFRDIGSGTVAVAGAAAGIRARYAGVEGIGGKLNALWGDVRGAKNFVTSEGTATSMYGLMKDNAGLAWGRVAGLFKGGGAAAAGEASALAGEAGAGKQAGGFLTRVKELFFASEEIAAARKAEGLAGMLKNLTAEQAKLLGLEGMQGKTGAQLLAAAKENADLAKMLEVGRLGRFWNSDAIVNTIRGGSGRTMQYRIGEEAALADVAVNPGGLYRISASSAGWLNRTD